MKVKNWIGCYCEGENHIITITTDEKTGKQKHLCKECGADLSSTTPKIMKGLSNYYKEK